MNLGSSSLRKKTFTSINMFRKKLHSTSFAQKTNQIYFFKSRKLQQEIQYINLIFKHCGLVIYFGAKVQTRQKALKDLQPRKKCAIKEKTTLFEPLNGLISKKHHDIMCRSVFKIGITPHKKGQILFTKINHFCLVSLTYIGSRHPKTFRISSVSFSDIKNKVASPRQKKNLPPFREVVVTSFCTVKGGEKGGVLRLSSARITPAHIIFLQMFLTGYKTYHKIVSY